MDGSANDVGWADTVDAYPALVFYPAHRKHAAPIAFPNRLRPTVPNVFAFILAHAGARLRWRIALALCNRQCRKRQQVMAEHEIGMFCID
jgi:hypothetical protein